MAKVRRHSALPLSTSSSYKPYVRGIGQAAFQWNQLHEALAVIFMSIMKGEYTGQYLEVWGSIASDRGKRDALKAATRSAWIHPDAKEERARYNVAETKIIELLGVVEALEETRNNFVHAPLGLGGNALRADFGGVRPFEFLSNARARKLAKKADILAEYVWFREYATVLGHYALHLADALYDPSVAWPDKPREPARKPRRKGRGSRRRPS